MTSNPLINLFGRSPIEPMQKHMEKAHACAAELVPFFEAVIKEDWTKAAKLQQKISKLENDADDLKKSVRAHLPKSLFLPVARTDLLELLSVQDRIANRAKDIAGLMLGRKMTVPAQFADNMLAYVKQSVVTSGQAKKAMDELDELLEAGFSGREVDLVEAMIVKLNDLEHETDGLERAIRSELFTIEKDLPPIDVMFFYRIIDWVGDLADRAQRVGSRLQILLAR